MIRQLVRLLRGTGVAIGLFFVLLAAAFGLAQTPPAKQWLAQATSAAIGSPDFGISVGRIDGIVPFRFTIARIAIADAAGGYASLRDVGIRIAPVPLLSGRVRIRNLSIGEIDVARLPASSGSSRPLSYYLHVPKLPAAVALDRLTVGRLALAPAVLGEPVVATIGGEARVAGDTARISFDLHRIDGRAGEVTLAMALAGAGPVLTLRFAASEPTGILADRLFGRQDHLPLSLSLDGFGPVADWHGLLKGSAGAGVGVDAQLGLAALAETDFRLTGNARLADLLPAAAAASIGNDLRLDLQGRLGRRIVLDRLSIEATAGRLAGDAAWDRADDRIAAHLHADLPDLSLLPPLFGEKLGGSAALGAMLGGSASRPKLTATLSVTRARFSGSGASLLEVAMSATPQGALGDASTTVDVAATGHVQGLVLPVEKAVPASLGRDLDITVGGSVSRDGRTVDLTRLAARGMGLDLTGSGKVSGAAVAGEVELAAADLRPFGDLLGLPLTGALKLGVRATGRPLGGFGATLDGSARDLQIGIASVDALLGGAPTLTAVVERTADGLLTARRIEIEGTAARLSGDARFDPASQQLGAALALDLPRLDRLEGGIAGAATIRVEAAGKLDRLAANGEFDGRDIAAAGVRLDQIRLAMEVPDVTTRRATIDGSFRGRALDGTVALTAFQEGLEIRVPSLRLAAQGGSIEGDFSISRDTGLVRGRLAGRMPDLARWSALAGRPLGGRFEFSAAFDPGDAQRLDLTATGAGLSSGTGSSQLKVGRLDAAIRLAGLRRALSVSGRLQLAETRIGAEKLATATLKVEGPKPGRVLFEGETKGEPLSVGFAGEGATMPAGAELRLDRLAGSLANERFALQRPMVVSRRGTDIAVSGLELSLGPGRISGSGELHGDNLKLAADASNLSIAPIAQALGYREIKGELSAAVQVGGNLRAPRGHVTLTARDLDFAAHAPTGLGLRIAGDWDGRGLAARGQITGLKGDSIVFSGVVPLRLTRTPLAVSVRSDDRLALNLHGKGRLDHLADLLPLGEDRVSGRFSGDVSIGGTIASPAASGHLTLADARWENFASGAVLTKVAADIAGDRDRFRLVSFSAADSGGGHIAARGSLALDRAAGPAIDLSAQLARFRIAARDEVVVAASGSIAVAGPIGNPKITGRLTIDNGEINLPQAPPTSITRLDVTVIDSRTGKRPSPSTPSAATEMASAALDLQLDAPGPIFVRGHGLDSQWRGRLTIRGTSAAPDITGRLEQIQGSFDLLGKTFQLTRGAIVFGGGATLDPTLDIVAEASAADIIAQIVVSGPASAPKIRLSSTPVLPEDEILARVLFGQSVGRISAAQGLQLAQAAAALAGGGPGVLDRLRGKLGLDWLRLGEGPSGPASSILNPALANPAGAGNAAVSAGKYLMPGVSVGVTQGVSPPTSKVTVQIEVRPHVTVQGEAGQSGSTGIGLNYQYDY